MALARGAGREEMPPVTRRTCSVAPRHAGGVSPIRPRGFIRRAAVSVASGMNGQEGAGPSDGVRLPTRSKPSKGVALAGMWTASESPSGGDDGSPETQRTPCPVPGCNRPGTCVAEETVEVVRFHRGGTRTAVGTPRSEPGRERGGSGRTQAQRRRGTRQSHGRMIFLSSRSRQRVLLESQESAR